MNRWAINKQRIRRVLTSKSLLPSLVAGGALRWLVPWLGTGIFAYGIGSLGAGILALGIGRAIWKLTVGSQKLTARAIEDIDRRTQKSHDRYLRQLRSRLRSDQDPRTGRWLRELRDLHQRMIRLGILSVGPQHEWVKQIGDPAIELYRSTLESLEQSLEVWKAAREIKTPGLRDQLLATRDQILQEVSESVEHLDKTLDRAQASQLKKSIPPTDLSAMRAELQQGLDVARSIEHRMNDLERDLKESGQIRE